MIRVPRRGTAQRTLPYPVSNLPNSRSPRPSTGAWSAEDDETLMNARAQGLRWALIAQRCFPDKTGNACRKRYERLMEKNREEQWEGGKIETLASEYLEIRQEMWQRLANRVGENWETVEAKCMEKGLKNLLQLAKYKKGSSLHDSDLRMNDNEAVDDKTAPLPEERIPLERSGMLDRIGEKWETVETKCMEKGLKNPLQLAKYKKGSSLRDSGLRDSGLVLDDDEAAEDTIAPLPEERLPPERSGMPSLAEIV